MIKASQIRRVMVLNAKGGCGKTTLATNLANYFAAGGSPTVLIDYDSQGSSSQWLSHRTTKQAAIHGIAAYQNRSSITRSFQLRLPPGTERVVIDTPGAVEGLTLNDLLRQADTILVPVLPSPTDMHAVTGFLQKITGNNRPRGQQVRIGLVANRMRSNTREYKELEEFLGRAPFPFIGELRETQNYVKASGRGIGIHDLPRSRAGRDQEQWSEIIAWVEDRNQSPAGTDRGADGQVSLVAGPYTP